MSQDSLELKEERAGVVCGTDEPRKTAMQAYLARQGIDGAKWFAPGALHDLDRAVRQGRIGRVIFTGLPDLLEAIWEEEIVYEQWPADVSIELIYPPGDDAVSIIAASWRAWRKRHRRRQAWAGLAVSVIVLAIAFALCIFLMR